MYDRWGSPPIPLVCLPINVPVGDTVLVAADASRKIKVLSYVLTGDGANLTAQWKSSASPLSGPMKIISGQPLVAVGSPLSWLVETLPGESLVLVRTGGSSLAGHCAYFLEP